MYLFTFSAFPWEFKKMSRFNKTILNYYMCTGQANFTTIINLNPLNTEFNPICQ